MEFTTSPFSSFRSKKALHSNTKSEPSDQINKSQPWDEQMNKTPVTPQRKCLRSLKQIREAALKLSKAPPNDLLPLHSPINNNNNKKKSLKIDQTTNLPQKYEILCKFFESLSVSLRLLRIIRCDPLLMKNITPQIERLTDRRFSIANFAQLKFILPEVIELKKRLVRDDKTCCMKPDLYVTLNASAIKNSEDQKDATGKPDMKSIFRTRMLDFIKAHPEEEVPEEPLPVPFNRSGIAIDISSGNASSSSLLNETSTEAMLKQPAKAASHLPQTFQKRFSKQLPPKSIVQSGAKPITQEKCLTINDSQAFVPLSRLPGTPIKGKDVVKDKVSLLEGTPSKIPSTPGEPMSATPIMPTQKRCYMTPDADSTSSANKLARRPLLSRSLKFDTPVKSAQVEDEVKGYAGDLSSDDDIYDILPKSLVQSIMEKELKIQEESDPAISQAKRRQQMIANMPKLFDMVRYSFQPSTEHLITKEEFLHKLVTGQVDIMDRKEVEDQLSLLKELVPDLICEKLASSGDILIGINKIVNPELIRARLVQEK